ncbi:MAG: hypothetical protein HY097_03240 [Nitrospinae bacterium]|nr:hypothetical protein [Nitrospinota bacterium]MBI3812947.1 hypothetical protein [Nitrospinota bacterium]
MDSTIVAALIGIAGIVIGAILKEVLPASRFIRFLSGKPMRHSIIGNWKSSWGRLPNGPVKYHELLKITKQSGDFIRGTITREEEPNKLWEFEGRYDGQFLQLYYFPSKDAMNTDFLDYGCYFFRRAANGSFVGYSTGFGNYEETSDEGTSTDYHEMRRI